MSRQAQYAMLATIVDPISYVATTLLPNLLKERSDVAKTFQQLRKQHTIRFFEGYGLVTLHKQEVSDEQLLALFLQWIIDSKLARIPVEISNQLSTFAARVFDYPDLKSHAISEEMGRRSRGKSKSGANLTKDDRESAIRRAMKRQRSDQRSDVVRDLANDIGTSVSNASKELLKAGWAGRKGRPKNVE
jgi:hypothetical protein